MTTAHHFTPSPSKTYATQANAVKAVEKLFGENQTRWPAADLHYVTMQTAEGRWFPLFIGERALQHGVHFHFPVMA